MPNNSLEIPLSSFIEQDHSFIFKAWAGKDISAAKPLEVFSSPEALDNYLLKYPEIKNLANAGFAGYISFEGSAELALYENINIVPSSIAQRQSISNTKLQITRPDSQLYINAVKKCQEYIKEGDIYQANIAHKFTLAGEVFNYEFFEYLYSLNPSPYAALMNFSKYQFLSFSPEKFFEIKDGFIYSSPIKGTAVTADQLMASDKEQAEHIMIVDLMRNDLGRICSPGSIELIERMQTHKFKNLYHLISTIRGNLNDDLSFATLFKALCPGGSISGTPKIRAIEIIRELESCLRGPYTGTMGYYRFRDGGIFNILIRTIVVDKTTGEISFHSGSGITAYSDPEKELEETYLKAKFILDL